MPLKLDHSNLGALVNTLYGAKVPAGQKDAIAVDEAARRVLGSDRFISSQDLKKRLQDPAASVAFRIDDPGHPEVTRRMAEQIAADLDRGDGRDDGRISIRSKTLFDHVLPGGKIDLPRGHITSELSTGFVVIGPDGQLMPALWAKSHGKTVLSLHQGNDGLEITAGN